MHVTVLEQIAVSDLKLRVIVCGGVVTFATVFALFSFGLQSMTGLALGVVVGIPAAFVAGSLLLQLAS